MCRSAAEVATKRALPQKTEKKKKKMLDFSKTQVEQDDGALQLLSLEIAQQVPAPQTSALKLTTEFLSPKVWVLFQRVASLLGTGWVNLHVSPLRAISQFITAPGSCGQEPRWSSKPDVSGLISLLPVLKVGVSDVGNERFASGEQLQVLSSLLIVRC